MTRRVVQTASAGASGGSFPGKMKGKVMRHFEAGARGSAPAGKKGRTG